MNLTVETNWKPEDMWDKGLSLVLLIKAMMDVKITSAQLVDVNTNSMRFGLGEDYALVIDKDLSKDINLILENPKDRGNYHRYMNCIIQYLTLQGGLANGERTSTRRV